MLDMTTPIITQVNDDLPALVRAAEAGDETAWSELVDRFSGLVWHVIQGFRLPRAVGEDVFQTTWLRLTEHLSRIRQPESLGGWLARTAKNECLRAVTLGQRERLDLDEGTVVIDLCPDVDRPLLDESRDEVLWQAFEGLPDACQRLLRLLIADPPLSYLEVSEMLDMPIGSIGPTRARCLSRLRSSRGVLQLEHDR
jgi:RNA polymerase sigma factor (sigma-70 family)